MGSYWVRFSRIGGLGRIGLCNGVGFAGWEKERSSSR